MKIFTLLLFIITSTTHSLWGAEYTFQITIPESESVFQSEDVYPFVSLIEPSGSQIIIDNRGRMNALEHSSGVNINRTSKFFEVLFEVTLPAHLTNECIIWLSNSVSVDDLLPGQGQSGKSLPSANVSLYKNKELIMRNNFDLRKQTIDLSAVNSHPDIIAVNSKNAGLWKVCTIIPYYDSIKWDNEFFPRDRVVTGKIWNSALKQPLEGASVFVNNERVTESDERGIYYYFYNFGATNIDIYSQYEQNRSEIVSLSDFYDERPRVVNLSISYRPDPPPPENFRRIFYIYFSFNSSIIENNRENLNSLNEIAEIIQQYKITGKIQIEGHTDSIGSRDYNYDLSYKRAGAVAHFLSQKSFLVDKFVIKGFGKDNPIASNETPEGREHNRRVEIVFQYER